MSGYRGIWIHPWDLMDLGALKLCERLAGLGFNAASLAVRYIEERQDTPGPNLIFQNPRRRAYTSEESAVYWRADPSRYAGLPPPLRPRPSRDVTGDAVKAFTKACREVGLRSVLWFPVLRWERAVRESPEYGVVDIYGSPVGHKRLFLCPSCPEVREALRLMVEELVEKYEFDELELDFIRYPEVTASPGSPLLSLALSPCFCERCRREAARRGLDLAEVAGELRAIVEWHVGYLGASGYCEECDYVSALHGELTRRLLESEPIRRWLSFRAQLITSLTEELARAARASRPGIRVSADLYPPSGSWRLGQDFAGLSRHLDGVKVMVYVRPFRRSPCRIPFETRLARELIGEKTLILGLASWPPTTPEDIRAQFALAAKSPVNGIAFYCFGWTPEENLRTIGQLWKEEV